MFGNNSFSVCAHLMKISLHFGMEVGDAIGLWTAVSMGHSAVSIDLHVGGFRCKGTYQRSLLDCYGFLGIDN